MNITPRIITQTDKNLIGKNITLSLAHYNIGELWKSFMPRRKEINSIISENLYSVAIYPPSYFDAFDPATPFEKWATLEVTDFDTIPQGMETLMLPGGLYAVFDYVGSNTDNGIFQYIYNSWLPQSDYELDNRPHFEVLGEKYKNNDPSSEEEIWIPIKLKR